MGINQSTSNQPKEHNIYQQLISMGFEKKLALIASKKYSNIDKCIDFILENNNNKNNEQKNENLNDNEDKKEMDHKGMNNKQSMEIWKCDICKVINKTKENDDFCKKCKTKSIIITIKVPDRYVDYETITDECDPFSIRTSYSSSIKMEDIFNKIINTINNKYHPKKK
eukprot:432186_1